MGNNTVNSNDPIYGTSGGGGLNAYGFKAQPKNDSNKMANFLQTSENNAQAAGTATVQTGQQTAATGTQSFAPILQYLTSLTKGDQADINQATQPQVNQIKDSFASIRNMISQQPRGGGKAGVLAEAPYQQQKQIGDLQQGARQGAASQLGTVASSLAGIGLSQENLGVSEQSLALGTALSQRGQNQQERAALQQMIGQLGSAAGSAAAAGMK